MRASLEFDVPQHDDNISDILKEYEEVHQDLGTMATGAIFKFGVDEGDIMNKPLSSFKKTDGFVSGPPCQMASEAGNGKGEELH